MNRIVVRAATLACTLLATTAMVKPALATPPRFQTLDQNDVDLVTGGFVYTMAEGSIGSGPGAVTLMRLPGTSYGRTDQYSGRLYKDSSSGTALMVVELGTIADTFTISGTTYTSTKANGGTLTTDGTGNYTYTAPDGTKIYYVSTDSSDGSGNIYPVAGPGCQVGDTGSCAIPTSITQPNGMTFTLNYEFDDLCTGGYDQFLTCLGPEGYFRFKGVTSSASYNFTYTFVTDNPGTGLHGFSAPQSNWYVRTGATFTNLHSPPATLPTVTYTNITGGTQITDTGGRNWQITNLADGTTHVRTPGSSSDNIVVTYGTGGAGPVTSVVNNGVTTNYSYGVVGSTATMTVTDALSEVTKVVSDLTIGRATSVTVDPGTLPHLNRTTSYTYDTNGRVTRITLPEGNYTNYTYDSRGNVTQTLTHAKTGSGLADITTSAVYPSSCTNVLTCNEPTSTTDARGNETDYTYDPTHGGVLTVTLPAPTTGAVRPQTRFTYTTINGVHLPSGTSQCQTTSSCAGTADEVKQSISYDSYNLVPTSTSSGNGTGTLTATTSMTYDSIGNLSTVDGPLSGTSDTTQYRYNSARQVVGVVGPDPDGAGSLHNRATRTTYDGHGLVTKVEQGTVNSYSDTDWSTFSSLQEVDTSYDANLRPITKAVASGGITYSLTQTSYDGVGRVQCMALRMNPAAFGSLPSDACTLETTGSYGPDRITKTTYDPAGEAMLVQSAYGVTGVASNEVTTTYTPNGLVSTVTDANGNLTTYGYDGDDRRTTTYFPSPTTAGTSNMSDYEQLTLDANGNATARRLRDGNTIGYTYDALNRVTFKNLPGTEPDVTYTYDNLDRLTGASQTGNSLSYTYDALGRRLTETGPQGTVTSTYDIAARRTQITWPDSFYVNYDYLVTGEVSAIRENGAVSGVGVLASYAYDNLGRRSSISRGNGTSTTYGYDAVSRLTSLTQDLSGTTYDETLGFSYNPANQITQNTRSNDIYAWTGHGNGSTNSTVNGLNQLTAVGSTVPTFDSKGNMTYAGGTTYSYSSENLLTSSSGGASLTYDPKKRLYQVAGGTSGTQRFAYDGPNLIAEYDGSNNLLRRYVFGVGADDPIVWYEGTGTTDRRFLHKDEHGTIAAVTNSSGTVLNVDTYDEYGKPASTNVGRFQYTGQAYLPEVGLYYYKARMYASGLGRFMQSDPSGYDDGMNVYGYTHADPLNNADITGMKSGDWFKTAFAAAKDATASYWNPSYEYVGGIYSYTNWIGQTSYVYSAFPGYDTQANFDPSAPWSECIGCTLIAVWHTQPDNPYFSTGPNSDITNSESWRLPLFLGYKNITEIYYPKDNPNYKDRAGKTFKVNEPNDYYDDTYEPTPAEEMIANWDPFTDPDGLNALLDYITKCIIGYADVCGPSGPAFPHGDPKNVSSN
ncbi:MAG TPA: RHS repeat-associated core domain-containing protein [Allosphingosinicella sp.]|nr:RHS repeat-associated core domain-containing protein [Allosphingosinicella sp.]